VTQELIDETRLSAENQLLADLQKLAADGGNLEGRGDSYETPVSHSLVIIAINISSHLSRNDLSNRSNVRPFVRASVRCQRLLNPKAPLRDRWADVDDTRHVYSMGRVTKLLASRILNFGCCTTEATPNLAQSGEMTGVLIIIIIIIIIQMFVRHAV